MHELGISGLIECLAKVRKKSLGLRRLRDRDWPVPVSRFFFATDFECIRVQQLAGSVHTNGVCVSFANLSQRLKTFSISDPPSPTASVVSDVRFPRGSFPPGALDVLYMRLRYVYAVGRDQSRSNTKQT